MRWRLLVVSAVLLVISFPTTVTLAMEPGENFAKIFALRQGANRGHYAQTSVQDPVMYAGQNFSIGPIAATQWTSAGSYVEAGTMKVCDQYYPCPSGGRFPYAAWRNINGAFATYFDNMTGGVSLTPASYWGYSVQEVGNGFWRTSWCTGDYSGNCQTLITVPVGTTFNYVGSGGQSSCIGCPIGYINGRDQHFWNPAIGGWNPYCYTSTYTRYADGTQPSTCNSSNTSWSVNYK